MLGLGPAKDVWTPIALAKNDVAFTVSENEMVMPPVFRSND
jgi:hypothetical protein